MVKNKFGVPCSRLKEFITDVEVHCPSEECAMGLAAGCMLADESAEVYMQNSGLPRITDVVCSLYHIYRIPLPKLLISIRHKPAHHEMIGKITRDLLKLMNYTGEIEIVEEKI